MLRDLPAGAVVGTSSLRRAAQLKAFRPELTTASLRGNVPTRIQKLQRPDGPYDAIVLALAGLDRLSLHAAVTETLAPEIMLPAPGQGALAVQCRSEDHALLALLARIYHVPTRQATTAERAFLRRLDAGCHLPVAALAEVDGQRLALRGRVSAVDGTETIDVQTAGYAEEAEALGHALAEQALQQGAAMLLASAERSRSQ